MKNLLTIDVEDYFQVHALSNVVDVRGWDGFELRVERNTSRILEILKKQGVRATFFILGWVAERAASVVRAIADDGHEIASHGYWHQHISRQDPETFRLDVRRAKRALEEISKKEVFGYRAPTCSITNQNLWALKVLREEGYRYDSSIFPVRHDFYGIPSAPRVPFRITLSSTSPSRLEDLNVEPLSGAEAWRPEAGANEILEIPLTPVRVLGANIPVAGGGYFRIFPYPVVKWGLRRINREGNRFVFYLHPWEFDPGQPRIEGISRLSRFRHYTNLDRTETRFRRLLRDFSFDRIDAVFPMEG